jgi:four helix bundle protein
MTNFKQLKIWNKGFEIAVNSLKLAASFPDSQKFGLSLQISKSGISIPSNIAEGSSKSSEKDYNRFLEISLGSSFELETQVLIAQAVNFGNPDLRLSLLKDIDEEQKMLLSFMRKLNK